MAYIGLQPAAAVLTTAEINDNTITTADIADGAITTAKMAASGVAAATYGNASLLSSFTVDCSGRITTASNISLATGVQPGSYGNASYVPSFSVDSTGRITSACNLSVNSASDLYPCYTVCPGQCIIKGTPVGICNANVFNLCGDPLTTCFSGIAATSICAVVAYCCGVATVCPSRCCIGDTSVLTDQSAAACVINQGTRNWTVIEQTSANTMLLISTSLSPIGFNNLTNALCAGCCNTANVFCSNVTLLSPCWKFANFCVDPSGAICNPNVCCLAACPCVGCVQCTDFSLYCRQCSQRTPWPGPVTAGNCTDLDTFACSCNLDRCSVPLLTVEACGAGETTKAQGRPGGFLGTLHKFAVSCTGNVAYLMFYEMPSGISYSACTNINWACHPFSILNSPCFGVRSMMVFCKCTGSNLFCTMPFCYCCYANWCTTPSGIRFGHLTRNRRFMFDDTVTCRGLCADVCATACVYNCTCIYVAEINDTFCPRVTSAGVAGTGRTYPECFIPQARLTGCNQVVCWEGAKTRWFPLAENCDGWIIGFKPLSIVCIQCSVLNCHCYHLTSSVPRFYAIRPLATGSANVTSFVCGAGFTSNVSVPWILPTSVCETAARCCNFTLLFNHCANSFHQSTLASNVCITSCGVSSNGFCPPSSTLIDVLQVCPNIMRAYFITAWPNNFQPTNGSNLICICNVGAACTFYTYHCLDLCVSNSTNSVCILSEPNWRDLCTGACVAFCNFTCCFISSNMVCRLASRPADRYSAGYNFALFSCDITNATCHCIKFDPCFCAPTNNITALDIDGNFSTNTLYGGAEGGLESYAVPQYTCFNIENGRLIEAYYLSSCGVNCPTGLCCCVGSFCYYRTFTQVYGRETPALLAGSCFATPGSCNTFNSCIVLGECTRSCRICADAVTNIGTGYAYGFLGGCFGCYTVITSNSVSNCLYATRAALPNQNNTRCFIGFAAATGCGGACIPVAVGRLQHFVCDIKCFNVGVCPVISTCGCWCLQFTGYPATCLINFCACPTNLSPCVCSNCTTMCLSTLALCLCIMCDYVQGIKNGCYFN